MRKKASIALIFILMLGCLTACSSNGGETSSSSASTESTETPEQVEQTSAEISSGDRVFERALNRTIPEGYEEVEWDDDVRAGVTEMYTLVENPQTEMLGLADYEGNIVIETKYSNLDYVYRTTDQCYFTAEYEGETGIINGDGEETVAFDDADFKLHDKRMLRFEVEDNIVTCISLDITNGEEIGRFEIQTSSTETTISGTEMGPNGWVFPVAGNLSEEYSLGIWSSEGRQLNDIEMQTFGLSGLRNELETRDSATDNGYTCQPIKSSDGDSEAELCIFDKDGNIVAGPYKRSGENIKLYDYQYDSIFLIYEDEWNGGDHFIDPIIYVPELDKEISVEGILDDRLDLAGVFDNGVALIYTEDGGIAKLDLQTAEVTPAQEKGDLLMMFKGGDRYIFRSNETYKISDLEGNEIGDNRYYNIYYISTGAFLKLENGDWVYVDVDGNLSEETSLFHGDDDKPTTYNNLPIVGYWSYEGTPCVVVEENGKQVGYAL